VSTVATRTRRQRRWREQRTAARTEPWLRRLAVTALPLAAIYAVACTIYGFQAWHHAVPWLFQDEVFYAQQAQSFAETGEITIRGTPQGEDRLTAIVSSVAWRIGGDPESGYLLAKLLNVLLMAAACFPAYGLARIVVNRRWALFAAAGSVAIPAFVYSSMMLTEPFGYLMSTTALWLTVRTLASERVNRSTLAWGAAAIAATFLASEARAQLKILFPAFLLAAGIRILISRRVRARPWLVAAGSVLLAGALFAVYWFRLSEDAYVLAAEENWDIVGRQIWWTIGAFSIGLAVVTVVIGLAALWPTGERRHSSRHLAFSIVASSTIAALLYYTAVKGTFLWLTFAWRVIERNVIYASPLLFVAVAIFFQYRRLNPIALAASLGVVAYAVYEVPYQLEFRIYSDAPGLAILSTANRHLQWTDGSVHKYLAVLLVLAALVALAPYVLRSKRILRAGAATVAVLLVGAGLTAEVAADRSARGASAMFAANLPKPYDWVYEATDGERSLLLGTAIADPNGIWLTEFFNPNLYYVASLDATAPSPGPTPTAKIADATGRLSPGFPDVRYAVVDNKIEIEGEVLERTANQTLWLIDPPLRLTRTSFGVMSDGWMSERALFYQFNSDGESPGAVRVRASRAAWGGPDKPAEVQIKVAPLLDQGVGARKGTLVAGVPWETQTLTIHTRQIVDYLIPVPSVPFVVEINVDPIFSPADYGLGDTRLLGIQPAVEYLPGINLNRTLVREVNPPARADQIDGG
jgi:hypothetical protein